MKLEIEEKAKHELIQVLRLCQPEHGYKKVDIAKVLDAFFSKDPVNNVILEYKDMLGLGKKVISLSESKIILRDTNQEISIEDIIRGLTDEKCIDVEIKTHTYNGNQHKRQYFKVRNFEFK